MTVTWPIITQDAGAQASYEHCRSDGMDHDEAFVRSARRVARRRVPIRPYEDGETLSFTCSWHPAKVSSDFEVQVRYFELRMDGQSHNMAEILATHSFPGTKGTDRAFMQGRHRDGSQFEGTPDIVGKEYVRKALAAGVNPAGKYYSGPLARFPGDPMAWVDGLDDVKRIARERNLNVQGAVEVEAVEYDANPAPGPYRVADDILQDKLLDVLEAEPERDPEATVAELTTRLAGVRGA